ncbi:uncharacterized protein [Nicotiana sylvestris]|uniref:uncharacterized protein n=1 Tax=Nicotiana sylvestris TaxID=4096 RepID=UPI00388CDC8B
MDAPKKERSQALRIAEGADLEEDETAMITRDFKKYLMREKCSSRGATYNKPRVPKNQTNEGYYKCGKTDHIIKNYPQWEIEWKKERAKRKNKKKEQVHPKKNKGSTKAMVASWGESSNEDSEDKYGDEQALLVIGESDDEQEVSVIHLKDKIKFLSKERLFELLLDFIDESEVINNEKGQLSKECVILKAKCKNLELKASESDSKYTELKNQVLELDTTLLEIRFENLKLKLGTGKKKVDHIHLNIEENLGKMKDELYKKDEQIRVLKEDLGKVKHELDRTCKWNKSSDALSWLQEHHSSDKRGLDYKTPGPKWDPKSKYITFLENKICTYCGKTGHFKSEYNAKEKANQKNKTFVQGKNRLLGWVKVKGSSQIWYMDSGFSKHMTGSKNQFLSLEDLKRGNVSFENGKKGEIIGGKRVNNIYIVDMSTLSENELTCISVLDNDPLIWHKRLGHASLSQLIKLVSKDLVIGLPNIKFKEDKVCEACARGKQRQEHEDKVIGLVKELNEASPEEGTGDGTGSSIQGNLTGGTEQRRTESDPQKEPVHEHDAYWVNTMQDELNQFERSQVRNKLDEDGIVTRNKARLVVQGYSQEEGIDYDETFAPIVRLEAIKLLIAFVANMKFTLHQIDVKSAFLNGYLKEEVFVKQPPGFESKECPKHIHKLDKALNGLKQAPRVWYERMSKFLLEHDYKRGKIDNTLFLREKGLCARFQANPKESHLTAIKRILRYLKGTTDLCLWYPKGSNFNLVGYTDANNAAFLVDRKSTSGMAHFLGSCLVSWPTKKQYSVALSTGEAEYVAAASCMIKRILSEEPGSSVLVHLNNESNFFCTLFFSLPKPQFTNPPLELARSLTPKITQALIHNLPPLIPPPLLHLAQPPQPRRRRVTMLARKTVATGALSKRLNEKSKANQAQDFENSDDSFKSASEGEGTGSSNSEKAQNSPSEESEGVHSDVTGKGKEVVDSSPTSELVRPAICGVEHATMEESSKKTWESGSGEAAGGLVNLISQADEPSSSIEETLADLLKKVGSSYDPKKRITQIPKAPITAKPSKKKKGFFSNNC